MLRSNLVPILECCITFEIRHFIFRCDWNVCYKRRVNAPIFPNGDGWISCLPFAIRHGFSSLHEANLNLVIDTGPEPRMRSGPGAGSRFPRDVRFLDIWTFSASKLRDLSGVLSRLSGGVLFLVEENYFVSRHGLFINVCMIGRRIPCLDARRGNHSPRRPPAGCARDAAQPACRLLTVRGASCSSRSSRTARTARSAAGPRPAHGSSAS